MESSAGLFFLLLIIKGQIGQPPSHSVFRASVMFEEPGRLCDFWYRLFTLTAIPHAISYRPKRMK